MAMTHDYLDYLNQRVGIAPANSQEELQAAEVISELMAQHDVESRLEDFETPVVSGLVPAIVGIVMFLGVLISGFGLGLLTFVGFLLAAIPAILAVLRLFGREPSLALGPSAQSQNVVAVHRATGPLVTKGNRPIVVVAHYDTPRENPLVISPLAPYLPLVHRLCAPCSYVAAACAFLQLMGFIPDVARVVIWIVGILACVPSLVRAVSAISERVSPCTVGANDNKSSVAALLGVLENVRPSGLVPTPRPAKQEAAEEPVPAEGAEPAEEGEGAAPAEETSVTRPVPDAAPVAAPSVYEEVRGVRHGEEALRALGILPETCEIEYVAPAVVSAPAPAPVPAEPEPVAPPEAPAAPAAGETAEIEPVPEAAPAADDQATRDDLLSTGRFSIVMDDGSRPVGEKDSSGLTNLDGPFDPDATMPAAPKAKPEAPSDPEWGKSSYRPSLSSVARRATLFDLPDPSAGESDPLASTDPNATRIQPPQGPQPAVSPASAPAAVAPEPIETISAERPAEKKPKNPFSGLLGRLRKQAKAEASDAESWLGSDDDAEDEGGLWRGGATVRGGLRLVDEQDAPGEDELRDAVLSLGDDALIAHDVWFVALGGSALDHAGMKAFLRAHRPEIRGAFVVNLDCVGAGTLSLLKSEGLETTRRADRRISRLLTGAAADLHLELGQRPCDWAATDATPAMLSSLRSVTIRGVDDHGLPALSHTPLDVPDNVSGDQAALVTEVVTEMIRRA